MARASPLPPVVFFDAVGTLIHPDPPALTVYAAAGRRRGSRLDKATIAARFRTAFHRQEEVDRAAGWRTSEDRELARWRAIVAEVLDDATDAEACFAELYDHFARPDAWRCEPETTRVLETLAHRGHILGIASNYDARLRGVVEGLPSLRPIRYLIISSEVGWRKPAAAFFVAMCQRAGYAPEQVLYVGDDPVNDYEGARTAGMRSLLFDPRERKAMPREACIKSFSDLL